MTQGQNPEPTWPLCVRKVGAVLRKRRRGHLVSNPQRLRGKTGWVDGGV